MLDQDIMTSINESVLCWLATVDENGEPNVSPKEMFIAEDAEHLLIANIASPNSVRNIRTNPAVCVSFIHVFKQKGYKVKGEARLIEPNDPEFIAKEARLRTLGGEQFTIKSIMEITVKKVSPILAPSYHLFPDTTEHDQIEQAMTAYGVQRQELS